MKENEIVLGDEGRDPEIVRRDRSPLFTELNEESGSRRLSGLVLLQNYAKLPFLDLANRGIL